MSVATKDDNDPLKPWKSDERLKDPLLLGVFSQVGVHQAASCIAPTHARALQKRQRDRSCGLQEKRWGRGDWRDRISVYKDSKDGLIHRKHHAPQKLRRRRYMRHSTPVQMYCSVTCCSFRSSNALHMLFLHRGELAAHARCFCCGSKLLPRVTTQLI